MNSKLFLFPLGVQCTPIRFKRDPLSALGIAGIVSGIASGIGSIYGASSSNSTSKAIAKDNRDWQSSENAINRNWSESMWNKENVYNSPEEQRKRLEAAGINPFLSDSVGTGEASTPNSPAMVGAPNQPEIRPVDYGAPFQGLNQALGLVAGMESQKSEALLNIAKSIPDLYKAFGKDGTKKLLKNVLGSSPSSFAMIDKFVNNELQNSNSSVLQNNALASMEQLRESILRQTGLRRSKTEIKELEQRIKESASRISLMISEGNVNVAKVKEIISQVNLNNANASTVNAMRNALVNQILADIALKEAQTDAAYSQSLLFGSQADRASIGYQMDVIDYDYKEANAVRDYRVNEWKRGNIAPKLQPVLNIVDWWFNKLGQASGSVKDIGAAAFK